MGINSDTLNLQGPRLDTSLDPGWNSKPKSDPLKVGTDKKKTWFDDFLASPGAVMSKLFGVSSFQSGSFAVESTGTGFKVVTGKQTATPQGGTGSGILSAIGSVPWYGWAALAGGVLLVTRSRR